MRKRQLLFALLAAQVMVGPLLAQDLPSPPEGFSWKRLGETRAAFLMPETWHYKETSQGGTLGYFITKENIDEAGRHETGLTVNIIPNLQGRDAVQYAEAFVAEMSATNELIDSWTTTAGALEGFGCLTRNVADEDQVRFRMHTLAIGNEKTNTLYIMWFESPEETWESAWETGAVMLERFVIDDDT